MAVDNHMERVQKFQETWYPYAMKADIGDAGCHPHYRARNLDGVIVAVADDMEASVMATLVSKEMGVPYVMAKANKFRMPPYWKRLARMQLFSGKGDRYERLRNLVSMICGLDCLVVRIQHYGDCRSKTG